METPTGGGRDSSRFNMGYNMSLISGETSPELYGTRPSSSGVSRPGMTLPSSCGAGMQRQGIKRTSSDVCFDQDVSGGRSGMSSQGGMGIPTDCVTTDLGVGAGGDDGFSTAQKKTPPPNGKKTKGRVKIKMEYIDNKLRRYTTFSKRKTGIMKKAYELSTLTGTQVMLLVASETGHVYTFATRKLQPMITSEAGKALIQTCLNSPDPPPSGVGGDQRMSATGFEETELTYNIGDEEQKEEGASPRSDIGGADSGESSGAESPPPPPPPPEHHSAAAAAVAAAAAAAAAAADMRGGGEQKCNAASSSSAEASRSPVTVTAALQASQVSQASQVQTPLISGMMNTPYTGVMYQTSQGMVYATPTSALPNGVIFSLSQGQLQQLQQDGAGRLSAQGQGPQQFITIPFPVTLAASNGHPQEAADLTKGRK